MDVKQKDAARLFAEGHTISNVIERLGVTRQTVYNWRQREAFQKEQDRISKLLTAGVTMEGIARKEERVRVKQDLHGRLMQIVIERAEAAGKLPDSQVAPGQRTGLLLKRLKSVRDGDESKIIREWIVDTNIVREITNIHEVIAKELGQTTDEASRDALADLAAVFDKKERDYERQTAKVDDEQEDTLSIN